ncbi:MAG: Hsp20/alpha crystallin family protein [Deltaproteobacteria bacterium]|nr:Hsp20/alpha crystallin family protein [Deltaproteobacteria bacterium]
MKALTPWRPRRELERMEHRMRDLFDQFWDESLFSSWDRPFRKVDSWEPAIESHVENGNLVVKADLPGIDPKDISLSVTGNQLTIEGERKEEEKKEEKNYLYHELSYGKFSRTMELPAGVEADKVKAHYKDGMLKITMPAPTELAAKKIQIEASK